MEFLYLYIICRIHLCAALVNHFRIPVFTKIRKNPQSAHSFSTASSHIDKHPFLPI